MRSCLALHSGATLDAISYATCVTARELGATALVTATQSGHTARMVSKYRPQTPDYRHHAPGAGGAGIVSVGVQALWNERQHG